MRGSLAAYEVGMATKPATDQDAGGLPLSSPTTRGRVYRRASDAWPFSEGGR